MSRDEAGPAHVGEGVLRIRGARHHNLKNIDLDIPKYRLVVVSGLSGSGKSTLAFDTIYAEGQRRYVESLSTYARQFLEIMDKPDVDTIDGLSPAISIQQKTTSKNPRSTVGTTTEIYDYLRLLFARIGVPYCIRCRKRVSSQSAETITDSVLREHGGKTILVLAPVVRNKKGTHEKVLGQAADDGRARVRIDGEIVRLDGAGQEGAGARPPARRKRGRPSAAALAAEASSAPARLDKNLRHNVELVMDRLTAEKHERTRLFEAIEAALAAASGYVLIVPERGDGAAEAGGGAAEAGGEMYGASVPGLDGGGDAEAGGDAEDGGDGGDAEDGGDGGRGAAAGEPAKPPAGQLYSQNNACPHCGFTLGDLEPRTFSFNSPFGMCPACNGIGSAMAVDPRLVIPDASLSILDGAVVPWRRRNSMARSWLVFIEREMGIDLKAPVSSFTKRQLEMFLYGIDAAGDEDGEGGSGDDYDYDDDDGDDDDDYYEKGPLAGRRLFGERVVDPHGFSGVVPELEKAAGRAYTGAQKAAYAKFMREMKCRNCEGSRLKPEALAVTVGGKNMREVCDLSVDHCYDFFASLSLGETEAYIAKDVLKEVRSRLEFLKNVGLNYVSLNRGSSTLSGGEAQRIRLATQIGSNLTGVLYVLDEPTIGLHQRDNARLIKTLLALRDLGNTVMVVEHDEEVIRSADWLVDMGPGAGVMGGGVVFEGTLERMLEDGDSITGRYLRGGSPIRLKGGRRAAGRKRLVVRGAAENNLKGIDVEFPLGLFTVVTGVSGSGKSTLINDVLLEALHAEFYEGDHRPGVHDRIDGISHVDKVIAINQSPIGRTPRSNPATYIGAFTPIRDLYAGTAASREHGYSAGQFSFNVEQGRCMSCDGDGVKRIEMQFLSDVYVKCDECKGRRYTSATLAVRYKGKSIADVLDMTAREALEFFENVPSIQRKMQTLNDVGLGYIRLGQSSTTLSGGEAQRIKLAAELSKRSTGRTMYVLDEPTTGLHFADVQKLLDVLDRLVDLGNTVVVIEHNMDVIRNADWIIDLGPEGGDEGGRVVVAGTPAKVAAAPGSYTGRYLRMFAERGK